MRELAPAVGSVLLTLRAEARGVAKAGRSAPGLSPSRNSPRAGRTVAGEGDRARPGATARKSAWYFAEAVAQREAAVRIKAIGRRQP
jgi:hypothetical protein